MRPQFRLQRRGAVLTTFAATGVLLAAKPVFAQDDNNNDNEPSDTAAPPPESTAEPAPEPSNTDDAAADPPSDTAEPTESTAPPETDAEEPESTAAPTEPTTAAEPTETTAEAPTETTEEAETTETDAETSEVPMATDSGGGGITGGPTLTRGFGIPEYPAATVPPTYHAPFMQHSTAPDGTVFIAVGAILGAFGLGILLWRVIVGLLLHRSVERAAMAQHDANSKAGFPAPPAPFYKYTDQGSNMSLNGGAAAGRGVRRTQRGPIPSSNPSQSNLFFSPTAAASGNNGNRGSAFLPSGFYAAGGGANSPNHTHSISLTNLRPDSRGHGAGRSTLGPSPPDSPSFPAQRRDVSSSSLNLARPSSQRAPSAYLDDLLADDPGALPPPHMPPQQGPSRNSNLGPGSNRF